MHRPVEDDRRGVNTRGRDNSEKHRQCIHGRGDLDHSRACGGELIYDLRCSFTNYAINTPGGSFGYWSFGY